MIKAGEQKMLMQSELCIGQEKPESAIAKKKRALFEEWIVIVNADFDGYSRGVKLPNRIGYLCGLLVKEASQNFQAVLVKIGHISTLVEIARNSNVNNEYRLVNINFTSF